MLFLYTMTGMTVHYEMMTIDRGKARLPLTCSLMKLTMILWCTLWLTSLLFMTSCIQYILPFLFIEWWADDFGSDTDDLVMTWWYSLFWLDVLQCGLKSVVILFYSLQIHWLLFKWRAWRGLTNVLFNLVFMTLLFVCILMMRLLPCVDTVSNHLFNNGQPENTWR